MQIKVQQRLLKGAARLIGVSHFEADQFQRWLGLPPDKFTVVYNGASMPPIPTDFVPPIDERETILSVAGWRNIRGITA